MGGGRRNRNIRPEERLRLYMSQFTTVFMYRFHDIRIGLGETWVG